MRLTNTSSIAAVKPENHLAKENISATGHCICLRCNRIYEPNFCTKVSTNYEKDTVYLGDALISSFIQYNEQDTPILTATFINIYYFISTCFYEKHHHRC